MPPGQAHPERAACTHPRATPSASRFAERAVRLHQNQSACADCDAAFAVEGLRGQVRDSTLPRLALATRSQSEVSVFVAVAVAGRQPAPCHWGRWTRSKTVMGQAMEMGVEKAGRRCSLIPKGCPTSAERNSNGPPPYAPSAQLQSAVMTSVSAALTRPGSGPPTESCGWSSPGIPRTASTARSGAPRPLPARRPPAPRRPSSPCRASPTRCGSSALR